MIYKHLAKKIITNEKKIKKSALHKSKKSVPLKIEINELRIIKSAITNL